MIAPSPRLAGALGVLSLLMLAFTLLEVVWLGWTLLAGVSVVALTDLITLLGRAPPSLLWDREIVGTPGRPALVRFTLGRLDDVLGVALRVPVGAGGPAPVRRPAVPSWSLALEPRARGAFDLGLAWVHLQSRFGLWRRRVEVRRASRLLVLPPPLEVRPPLAPLVYGPRARRGGRRIAVAIDVSSRMRGRGQGASKLDMASRLAGHLVIDAGRARDAIGVLAFGETLGVAVPPSTGSEHVARLLRALAELDTHPRPSVPRSLVPALAQLPRETLVLVLTHVQHARDATELVDALGGFVGFHELNVALLPDEAPSLDEDAELAVAVALVRREREQAIEHLRRSGLRVVDLGERGGALSARHAADARSPRG